MFGFVTSTDYFKYLVLYILKNITKYVKIIMSKHLKNINLDVNRQIKIPLSLWGKIYAVKLI